MSTQNNPYKVTPISVKFDDDTFQLVKEACEALDCSRSRVINRTVKETLRQIKAIGAETLPEIILMIRSAYERRNKPPVPWESQKPRRAAKAPRGRSSRRDA